MGKIWITKDRGSVKLVGDLKETGPREYSVWYKIHEWHELNLDGIWNTIFSVQEAYFVLFSGPI